MTGLPYYDPECRQQLKNKVQTMLATNPGAINDVNEPCRTVLHEAAYQGNLAIVRTLLSHGAHVDPLDSEGMTPLHKACVIGSFNVVKFLCDHGADLHAVTNENHTPLHVASRYGFGHRPVVRYLLKQGAVVNARDSTGRTPLFWACEKNRLEAVDELLRRKADTEIPYEGQAEKLIHKATFWYYDSLTQGTTPLQIASHLGNEFVVKLLLEHKADVNSRRDDGLTALSLAADADRTKVASLILQHKARTEVDYQDDLVSPLILASWSGNLDFVQLLLNYRANANVEEGGKSPLFVAVWESGDAGHRAVAELLLKHGADVNFRSSDGVSVIEEAARSELHSIVKLFSRRKH